MTLRREIVDFVRGDLPNQPRQRAGVAQIAVMEKQPRASGMGIGVNRLQPSRIKRTRAADDAVHFIVFRQQELGKVRAVLSCDARNQCFFSHAMPLRFVEFLRDGKSGKA